MLTSPDFKSLLNHFKSCDVRFLVVGGYAVMRYTEPRFTKDLDLWIATDDQNADAAYKALADFGAPLKGMAPGDFARPGHFYQLGMPPLRVDIMMSLPGVEFESCWGRRETVAVEGVSIPFISRADLIRAKKASGRAQDLIDVENLEKAGN
ncbi:nucleotidyltransferase [Candidatus Sumerlaeota bacterium]|nr:nucleotidyltransferase [Candidatus Sumerlaeota bacterium]